MLITNREEFDQLKEELLTEDTFVFDIETDGLRLYQENRLIGVSFYLPTTSRVCYLPFRHKAGTNLPITWLYELAPIFADPTKFAVAFNTTFDVSGIEAEGISVFNRIADVMQVAHLAYENEGSFALASLAAKYFGEGAIDEQREMAKLLKSKKLGKGDLNQLTPEEVAPYACEDVILTWSLLLFYHQSLEQQDLLGIWAENNKYLRAVYDIIKVGVRIDVPQTRKLQKYANRKMQELQSVMEEEVGYEFNPRSVPQLRKILKQKSTAKGTLEKQLKKGTAHPIAKHLVEHREWAHAGSYYYNKFLELIDENDRIHANLFIIGTVTGRLSCREPNLQGLTKKPRQYQLRNLIIPSNGYKFLVFDYNQAELFVLAHYLKKMYKSNRMAQILLEEDIHTNTAEIVGLDRERAKRMNYSMVYGISATGLASELEVPVSEAKKYLDLYHETYPGIRQLYNYAQGYANQHKYIPLWTGRRRHYGPGDETYRAMSNLIQGAVAEIMRIAITRLHGIMLGTRARMVLQVHDEILFEVPEQEVMEWVPIIHQAMTDFPEFEVQLQVEASMGDNYQDLEEVKV